jgi:hypothetical protein
VAERLSDLDRQPPYLSVVMVGRNDDHGIKFADRLFAATTFNREQLLAHGIPHEYVFVDWAYDPSRELFARMLKRQFPWLHECIAVDRTFQETTKKNPRMAFMEFWAKNVGIRRARGRFILTTNSDVFLSRGLIEWLANAKLAIDRCYRALRVDIKIDVTCKDVTHELLESAEAASYVNLLVPPYYMNASGDFIMASREVWDRCQGFNETIVHSKVHLDGNFCANAVRQHQIPLDVVGKIWHLEHKSSLNLSYNLYGLNNELAPWGPDWDYTQTYRNPDDWGLATKKGRRSDDGILLIDADGP